MSTTISGVPPALTYRAAIDLPVTLAQQLASLLHAHTTRWRILGPYDRAVLTLAYLRKNETYESLAAGFGVGTATAWRYVQEAVTVLASLAPDLGTALAEARPDDAILVDGTVIATDRVGAKGFWSGKHHHPGVNVQAVADLRGRPLWLSGGLGASTHDRRAVQVHGLDEALAGRLVLADLGYLGTGWLTPARRAPGGRLTEVVKECNRAHSAARAPVEWVFAQLKQWRCLRRFRGCPHKVGVFVAAIGVLTWWGW